MRVANIKAANYDEYEEADEETQARLNKELEKAETEEEPYGKPGSLLNRLIMHGNKKTEEEIAKANAAKAAHAEQASSGTKQAS